MPDNGARGAADVTLAPLHPTNRRHLAVLGGDLGIFQHARLSVPDPEHGHCVDDVARALEVDLLHARTLGWDAVAESTRRNIQFLEEAFDEPSGRFLNFRSVGGDWIGGPGSNDSLGRAMLALGETIAGAPDAHLAEQAIELFSRALKAAARVASPRAQASVVLGCAAVARSSALAGSAEARDLALRRDATEMMRSLATGLHARFLERARPGWPWPEDALTYENALLPRALIVAGHRGRTETMVGIGLQVLNWLIDVQTAPEGHLSPIGNGWWAFDGERSKFDQQPIEATALLLAAEAAYEATGDPRYRLAMERCYAWFLGSNDLGLRIAHPARGAGADGLTPKGVNRNEGAESTLMWLMAAEHIRALRAAEPRVMVPMQAGRAARPLQPARQGVAAGHAATDRTGVPA
ncbi:MAG TPA: hypothetical protein VFP56_10350 [Candidatus Limnocylindrales bacterium]|nr:hypothetical protein [Candidatus Limnocylindrales bacterium]